MPNKIESLNAPVAVVGLLRRSGIRDTNALQQLTAEEALDALRGSQSRLSALTSAMSEAGLSFAKKSAGVLERSRSRRKEAAAAGMANVPVVAAEPASFEPGDPETPVEYLDLPDEELDNISDAGICTVGQLIERLSFLPGVSRERLEPALSRLGFELPA